MLSSLEHSVVSLAHNRTSSSNWLCLQVRPASAVELDSTCSIIRAGLAKFIKLDSTCPTTRVRLTKFVELDSTCPRSRVRLALEVELDSIFPTTRVRLAKFVELYSTCPTAWVCFAKFVELDSNVLHGMFSCAWFRAWLDGVYFALHIEGQSYWSRSRVRLANEVKFDSASSTMQSNLADWVE